MSDGGEKAHSDLYRVTHCTDSLFGEEIFFFFFFNQLMESCLAQFKRSIEKMALKSHLDKEKETKSVQACLTLTQTQSEGRHLFLYMVLVEKYFMARILRDETSNWSQLEERKNGKQASHVRFLSPTSLYLKVAQDQITPFFTRHHYIICNVSNGIFP